MKIASAAILSLVTATMAPLSALAEVSLPLSKKGKKEDDNHIFKATASFRTSKDVSFTKEQIVIIEEVLLLVANESYDADKYHVTKAGMDKATHGPVFSFQAQSDPYKYSEMAWFTLGVGCNLCDPDDDYRLMATKGKKKGHSHEMWENNLCDILSDSDNFEGIEGCEIYVDFTADLASDMVELVNPIVENAMAPLSALAELALPLGKKGKKDDDHGGIELSPSYVWG
jgi:hypothetical protein